MDDASILLASMPPPDVDAALDQLANQLQLSRDRNELVGVLSDFDMFECWQGRPLYEVLTLRDVQLSRDCQLRAYRLLDKCSRFDAEPDFVVDPSVLVDSAPVVSYALSAILFLRREAPDAVGTLALSPHCGRGQVVVEDARGQMEVFIIVDAASRVQFYRTIFAIEDIPQNRFLELCGLAFPVLRFAETLTFGKFEGNYTELRDVVARHLAALNDRFKAEYVRLGGVCNAVSAAVGIDLSIEGQTRQSERLMRLRDVDYNGRTYRCEWHSKLERHRNRIHFHPGDSGTDDCVLIAMFVRHLQT